MSDYQPTPPPSTPYASAPGPTKSPILSILSLIFGILGVVLSLFLFGTGFLPGAAAVVLGFMGRRKEPQAKGMWLTGLITGFVAVGIAIIVWIGLAVIVGVAGASSSN
jgi:succinate dehydrogenase/fumarate reductase cytochrome b subunit